MDTMFTTTTTTTFKHQHFISDHHSFNSTLTTSGSSASSTDHHQTTTNHHHHQQCFMEEASSSSFIIQQPQFPFAPYDVAMEFSDSLSATGWSSHVLLEAARALSDNNTSRLHHLIWLLNETSSPYGDTDEKLAFYFNQALYSRITDTGLFNYNTLTSISFQTSNFETTRNLTLKFQEHSPWTTFGHVAANGAIMESCFVDGQTKLHIIDISITYSTQWPTFLEALATRNTQETPHLRLTTVIISTVGSGMAGISGMETVMLEIGSRMGKFARLMGVPFEFNVIHHSGDLSELNFEQFDIRSDETLAVNLNGTLRSVNVHRRDYLISMFRGLNPKIVTVVEEEADLDFGSTDGVEFFRGFQECLRWFRVYFDSLDESFPKTSNERLMLEREAGRAVMNLVACSPESCVERRETAEMWSSRFREGGFEGVECSDEGCDDLGALVRRYREGWSLVGLPATETTAAVGGGVFLRWKETAVVWASAWKGI